MQSERPPSLSDVRPRIKPWLGGLLWLASNVVVIIFGQFLFPRAMVADDTSVRIPTNVAIGCVAFGVLFLLHVTYWRRVVNHLLAESRRHAAERARFVGPHALGRDFAAIRPASSPIWTIVTLAVGVGLLLFAAIIAFGALAALRSARSVDSPLLALLYAGAAVAPFGAAMTAVGATRLRRAVMSV